MSRKQLLARLYRESAPWHSADGWYCERCDGECLIGDDVMCRCCLTNLDALAIEAAHIGGDIQ